ncbi:hypothetical protein ASF23_12635 [Curtobacterium sp. Leaf261]|nr:hypothetical protein ASF23_12635 [Curtobacterium sp. Leaf261]
MSGARAASGARAVSAEWGKAWSLRSPVLCLAAVVPVAAVVAFTLGNDSARAAEAAGVAVTAEPTGPASTAVQIALLVLAAAAMLTVTSEYQGGTATATFLARPRRRQVVVAKSVVAAVLGTGAGFLAGVAADGAAAIGLGAAPAVTDLFWLAGRCAAAGALAGILVVGLGFVLRRSVGTLTAATVLLVAGLALPDGTRPWTPAGGLAAFLQGDGSAYPSWVGMCVLLVWALLSVAAGTAVVARRDA